MFIYFFFVSNDHVMTSKTLKNYVHPFWWNGWGRWKEWQYGRILTVKDPGVFSTVTLSRSSLWSFPYKIMSTRAWQKQANMLKYVFCWTLGNARHSVQYFRCYLGCLLLELEWLSLLPYSESTKVALTGSESTSLPSSWKTRVTPNFWLRSNWCGYLENKTANNRFLKSSLPT